MTDHLWLGGAPAVAQVDTITIPDDVVAGLVFKAIINKKTLSYTIPADTSTAEIAAAIVSEWNDSQQAEFTEITAADNGDGSFTLTGNEEGRPFIVSVMIGDGLNEKQTVSIVGSPTGGTFTLSVGGQTTAGIAYNASAATVETALEGLSTVGAGNVSVSGDAGGPYAIEFIGDLAGENVDPITADGDGLTVPPEVQVLDLGSPTGGTWTVRYKTTGTPTAAIAYDATAATVEAALETLSEVGVGNVSVAGAAGGPYTVTLQGWFNGINAADLVIDGSNLTGGLADAVTITEQTAGGGGGNEQWTIYGSGQGGSGGVRINGNAAVSAGTFDIEITLNATTLIDVDNIPYDVTPPELQALIDAELAAGPEVQRKMLVITGQGGAKLNAGSQLSAGTNFTITVPLVYGDGALALTVDSSGLTGGSYLKQDLSNPNFIGADAGYGTGNWKLTISGELINDIAPDITAAALQAEIEALTAVGAGNVTVEAIGDGDISSGTGWRLTFIGDLANQSTGLSINAANMPGSTHFYSVLENWEGSAGTASEVQRISIAGSPGSGQFGLTYANSYSAAIPYDTTASELEDILEAMPDIGVGNVSCSGGPFPDTAIDVTFQGGLAGTDLDLLEAVQGTFSTTTEGGDPATMTVATVQIPVGHTTSTAASGPNDWNTAANWDTETVPGNGDTVFIQDGDSIWYGLDQSAVSLAALEIHNYDVQIGLARRNDDYFEYRQTHLILGGDPAIIIGLGSAGSGSDRIFLDVQDGSPTIEIHDSGSGEDGAPAIQIIGQNTANTAELLILGGEVGVAYFPKQAAYFQKITQRAGQLAIGKNVTVLENIKTGGDVRMDRTTIDGLATL